jgi:hypothetical protein
MLIDHKNGSPRILSSASNVAKKKDLGIKDPFVAVLNNIMAARV